MAAQQAKFVEGSTMKHILTMSGAGSIGLLALFAVDLLDMLFISMLGQVELAAAVGFAGTLLFFSTSVSIGSSIAMGAMVSKALGAKQQQDAKRKASNILMTAFFISLLVTVVMYVNIETLLSAIGAQGVALERATAYLEIILPSSPLLALGMASGAALRAAGDAKRSMWATLSGGIVNAILDPIFIFGFNWNVEGAAASVVARITVLAFSIIPLYRTYKLIRWPDLGELKQDLRSIVTIAIPAIITNTATPIGNAIVTANIAHFGENYVAGFAVIGRVSPVAFAVIFALSGAVGPIIGQNYGAQRIDRVKETLMNSLLFVTVYCVAVSIILYSVQDALIAGFALTGDAAIIVAAFCSYIAFSFVFNGALFVANTSFNNLGKPIYSTALNLGKATLGTLPFVYFGAQWFGALGVLYGQAVGSIVFGILGIMVLQRHIQSMMQEFSYEPELDPATTSVNMTPFCNCDPVLIEEVTSHKSVSQIATKSEV
ncbi:MATE family efflux transporter [Vibrio tapetis]|uniref:Multidrug resistance protein NorM n=1 Tax=Vibrio tapetis subsp. tapetis TaxID=1671868 RepID=A0A2N8ZCV6_9VIBR|nr:MATE family efflux transporter [Vibrio tapetis]SON49732.1 putative Na(+) driven multidrug efflux pump [Vibrio tapetis subsp. tapetis]